MSKFLQNIEDKDISKMKEFLLDSFFSHVCSDKLMNNKELFVDDKTRDLSIYEKYTDG